MRRVRSHDKIAHMNLVSYRAQNQASGEYHDTQEAALREACHYLRSLGFHPTEDGDSAYRS